MRLSMCKYSIFPPLFELLYMLFLNIWIIDSLSCVYPVTYLSVYITDQHYWEFEFGSTDTMLL